MNHSIRLAVVLIAGLTGFGAAAQAQTDPPGRVGRLAFIEGTVSFHDDQQTDWSPAVVNTPLTSGDAIWTEPNARSEISVAGTRVRMDNGTQLDMLAIDDSQTRLQIDRGRIDIKTFTLDTRTPYQVVTPRGTITLQQQGDYYVEAGSTEDATRLGVRSGAAQIVSLNGQTLAVRAGEVGEISGDVGTPQLRTVNSAPPPPVAYWAVRDRQVIYDPPAQYLSAGITGYEDLNAYGSWSNDSQYGNVWSPRSMPSGWQPYRTGHWANVRPWGWTWIDDQPWGYAPYHYGRWANVGNRWVWVPPQRDVQPVYAPALVAFIGGIELSLSLGNQNNAPVGWFPLGPREVYVPAYTTNRDYYSRINTSNGIQAQVLDSRWQAAQRREAFVAGQNSVLVNQRFATVVPADTFVRSQPVARATLTVSPEKLAAAPVAFVAAPPAPTASLAATTPAKPTDPKAPANSKAPDPKAPDPKAQADAKAKADAQATAGAQANLPIAKTAVSDMPTLGKPAATQTPVAPGPKIAIAPAATAAPNAAPGKPATSAAPALVPRTGAAPPQLKDDKAPGTPPKPGQPEAKAPAANDNKATPATPATPAAPAAKAEPPKGEPAKPAPTVATPAAPATPAHPAAPAAKAEPPKAEPAKPAPSVAAPATPAAPAPAPKPEATRPAPAPAHPAPAAPQTGQQPEPKKDSGASNQAPTPSHPASPAPAAPQLATPAPPQHVTPSPAPAAPQLATPAPPQHVTPAPSPKPATAPAATAEEKKDEKKN